MSEATFTTWIDSGIGLHPPVSTYSTQTLEAKTRVNAPTLAANDIDTIKEVVKGKLYKQLLQQLMLSGCVSIESVRNPTNGSVTFTAKVELVEPSKNNETITAKAA